MVASWRNPAPLCSENEHHEVIPRLKPDAQNEKKIRPMTHSCALRILLL